MICAQISSLKSLQSPAPELREGACSGGAGLWLQQFYTPASPSCYIPTWTKAERSIQYNIYIFHYEIAISFPAFYLMHPE